jgi:hypothetical protein
VDKPLTFAELVAAELARARDRYPKFHSLHEAFATLLEEVDEIWEEIKRRPELRVKTRLLQEAVQVGAMIQRLAEDTGLVAGVPA